MSQNHLVWVVLNLIENRNAAWNVPRKQLDIHDCTREQVVPPLIHTETTPHRHAQLLWPIHHLVAKCVARIVPGQQRYSLLLGPHSKPYCIVELARVCILTVQNLSSYCHLHLIQEVADRIMLFHDAGLQPPECWIPQAEFTVYAVKYGIT